MNRDWYEYCCSRLDLPLEIKKMIFEFTFGEIFDTPARYYKFNIGGLFTIRHYCHHHSRITSYGHLLSTRYMLILMKDPEPKWLKFIQVRSTDGEFTARERRDHELALIKLY